VPEILEVGYEVGAASNWTRFERRLVMSAVMAYLLEPKRLKRRHRIRLVLLAEQLSALEGLASRVPARKRLLEKINSDLAAAISTLAKSRSAWGYKSDLILDLTQEKLKDQRDSRLRDLFGTGMTVRMMYDASAKGDAIGTFEARKIIAKTYDRNPLFAVNDKDLRNSWAYGQNVASLAAALLQFVSDRQLEKFRVREQLDLTFTVERFLAHAAFFEQFLLRPRTNPKLRFQVPDLIRLPPAFEIQPLQPDGVLWLSPGHVKKRKSALAAE
jgi:hypothetical protein